MEENCCAFTGHRPDRFLFRYNENAALCRELKAALSEQAELVYQEGIRQYWFGGAVGVDLWAAEAVLELKKKHPDIRLSCAIPFPGYDEAWRKESRERLARLLSSCVEVTTVCDQHRPDAYKRRNYYMVDCCRTLIAVFDQDRSVRSGTLQTVNYAKKQKRRILFIHPDTAEITVRE